MIIKDQLNQIIKIKNKPEKIVSLVPSITYSLSHFQIEKKVIGITRFCKYPSNWKKEKIIIGGTKDVKIDKIIKIKPDIIFANKEENTLEIVNKLKKIAPVYVSDVYNSKTNMDFINDLGIIFNRNEIAKKFIERIKKLKTQISKIKTDKKSIYLIWKNPYMTIGGDTYINQMMKIGGFKNLFFDKKRYPTTDIKEMLKLEPEILLLASEPYPFNEKHKNNLKEKFINTQVLNVSGEAFTWFGTYQITGLQNIKKILKEIK